MKTFLRLLLCSMLITFSVSAQWTSVNNNLGSFKITGLARVGTTLYAGTADKGIFTSADNGDSWSAFADNASLPSLLINGFEADAVNSQGINVYTQNGFAIFQLGALYPLPMGNMQNKDITLYRQYQDPMRRFLGTKNSGLFYSDDNAVTWTEGSGIPTGASKNIRGMMSQDSKVLLLVGTENGVYASTDRGNTWKDASAGLTGAALKVNNMFSLFALTSGGIYLTDVSAFTGWTTAVPTGDYRAATANALMKYYFFGDNVGTSIDLMTSQIASLSLGGITGGVITSTVLSGTSIFVGTETGGVFRADVSSLTDVNDGKESPSDFSLSQNYPNPFNPSTTIKYSVAAAGHVSLKVYSLLGTEVATLVNKEMKSGNYSVQFDASHLSSGIYFYQLKSGNVNITKRMLLIK